MIRSMTGFGRATQAINDTQLTVEVKSVNNRHLKISSRLPDVLAPHELRFEKLIKRYLDRGSVSLSISLGSGKPGERAYRLNLERAKDYFNQLASLASKLDGAQAPSLGEVARLPGVVEDAANALDDDEKLLKVAEAAVEDALKALRATREEEGKGLAEDLTTRCKRLLELNDVAKTRSPQVVAHYREKLLARLEKLLQGTQLAPREEDIAHEVALFADRCDIAEENQRLAHHCEAMIELITANTGEAGRRLDFIAQEMLREANTTGSKANDVEIAATVVEMKSEIEKIKEQVQNVE